MCFAHKRPALFRHRNFQKWSEAGVFCTFDLEMCFAPQRRALFRHRNLGKWSEAEVFCTFWLGYVLPATMACNFSSLIWPAGSAPAALASLQPTFRPSGATNQWKNTVFRDFPTFSRTWIFFLLLFSSLTLPISAFHLSILSEVWCLNFFRLSLTHHLNVLSTPRQKPDPDSHMCWQVLSLDGQYSPGSHSALQWCGLFWGFGG